jgi:hypothetical protein
MIWSNDEGHDMVKRFCSVSKQDKPAFFELTVQTNRGIRGDPLEKNTTQYGEMTSDW